MREVGPGRRGKQEEKNKPGTSERKAHFRYTGRPLAFGRHIRWNTMESWQKPEDVCGPNLPRMQSSGCRVLTRSDGGLRSHAGLPLHPPGPLIQTRAHAGYDWGSTRVCASCVCLCASQAPGSTALLPSLLAASPSGHWFLSGGAGQKGGPQSLNGHLPS